MIDYSNKENLSFHNNIIIPKPISTIKRSYSNIDGKQLANVNPITDNTQKSVKQNPIIKIKRGMIGSVNENMIKIEEAFKYHQISTAGIRFSNMESDQKSIEQKVIPQQQDNVDQQRQAIKSENNYQFNHLLTPQTNIHDYHISSNIPNSNVQNQKSITVTKNLSSINSYFSHTNKPDQYNHSQNYLQAKYQTLPANNTTIHLPPTITTRQQQQQQLQQQQKQQYEQENNQLQFKCLKPLIPQSSSGGLLRQDQYKSRGYVQTFENVNDISDEQGINKSSEQIINGNYLSEQNGSCQLQSQNNISNTNTFNYTNNNNNNNNNNLSAFFEQSTVCFNSTENDEANNFIRVFDKHMQDKQDLFRVQLETNDLLADTINNPISHLTQGNQKKLNAENTIVFDEKAFLSNANLYQEVDYIIFKRNDFNRLLLKQEAVQELLVEQQVKIKRLENEEKPHQPVGSERMEQKQEMFEQIYQELQHNDRVTRFNAKSTYTANNNNNNRHSNMSNQFFTDFNNFNQKINHINQDDFSNRILPTDKDEDCQSLNYMTDVLNIQTDESHSQFDNSLHARKSSNLSKYNSNLSNHPEQNSYQQTAIPKLSLQSKDPTKFKLQQQQQQSNMLQTFGQQNQITKQTQFTPSDNSKTHQRFSSYQIKNMFKKIPEINEEQQFQYAPENLSQLKSSISDQSRIMDENEEGTIRQSIKETCMNRIVHGQSSGMNNNCIIDGVETFRGNSTTTASSIQTLQKIQSTQSLKSLDNNLGQQNNKPPKNPAMKKIFSERSEYSSVQSNASTSTAKSGAQINFASTDRSHNLAALRSKSSLGLRVQSNPNEQLKINTLQSEDNFITKRKQNNTSSDTLPNNNTHHFRSHGNLDSNNFQNKEDILQKYKQTSEEGNCAIF